MIKILPIEKTEPYFKVVIDYMIGDADGYTKEENQYSEDEFEKYVPIILILKKLKKLKGHWGIGFDNYPKEYPGEYIGLTKDEYDEFYKFIKSDEGWEFGIRDMEEYYFLVFEGITVTYVDENNAEHGVELE